MKKYTLIDRKIVILWILCALLSFFLLTSTVYSYMTATASGTNGSVATGIVKIVFSGKNEKINATTLTNETTILPGDTLNITTKIQNAGNVPVYYIINLSVNITPHANAPAGTETITSNKFYSLSGSTLNEITQTAGGSTTDTDDDRFSNTAQVLNNGVLSSEFTASYEFNGETLGNAYTNAEATFKISVYAIQQANVGNANQATALLLQLAQES